MDTAQLVACELIGPDAAVGALQRHYRALLRHLRRRPHDALPTDVWDPGEDLVPFGGEGSRALQERMVDTLTNLMSAKDTETLLAVSHGSASRQFIKAAAPEGFELPTKLPNCAIMIFRFPMRQSHKQKASQCNASSPLQQIVDPQQSN